MKYLSHTFFIVIFIAVAFSCRFESSEDCSRAEIEYAQRQGEKDALKVCALDSGTMEHEEAILSIRAKEEELRSNGFKSAADAYVDAAESTLRSKGVIQ